MLAYLDALIAALSVRDAAEVARLLAHPLARVLSDGARSEAQAICAGESDPLAAPLRVMQLRHQTAELLRETPMLADRAEAIPSDELTTAGPTRTTAEPARGGHPALPRATRSTSRLVQMELPLSA